jgi:serine protease Do
MDSDSQENVTIDNSSEIGSNKLVVSRSLIVFTIIFSLVMGGVGGIGSVYYLSGTSLTKNDGSLTLPVKQKVTLEENSAFIDVAKSANPSVVSIDTSTNYSDFFGQVYQQKGGGTGFVISADGLIATNAHVVQEQNSNYTVILNDGKKYSAKIKDIDPIFDFAVLKIEATNLKPVDFGDSDELQIGQWVMAIGNALAEFQNSVTVGVVSAKERSITASDASGTASESLEGLIQTDAAINPGNSGGPLLNLLGKVIGVNTATSTSAQSVGFAIPINVLKPAIESVIQTGHIIRPALGIRYVALDSQIASDNKLTIDSGAYIRGGSNNAPAVISGGSADKAGLKDGDVITKINDQTIDKSHSLAGIIQQYKVGDKIKVTYYRDGKEQATDITLQEYKR